MLTGERTSIIQKILWNWRNSR